VKAVRVSGDNASGGAESGCADHLSFIDQLAVCFAGRAAEGLFQRPAHHLAAASDHERVMRLLEGFSDEHGGRALRDAGWNRACELLENHRAEVIRVAERLIERGEIDAAEFMRLMRGAE